MKEKPKVLVIGIDGATYNIIFPAIKKKKLPTFKTLLERGAWGILNSTVPPITVPAWDSMVTGMSPDKLGYSNFMVRDGYKLIPYFMKVKKNHKKVWDYLSYERYRIIVANVPSIYKAYPINGLMISGFLCPDPKKFTYPQNLNNTLQNLGFKMDIFDIVKNRSPTPQDYHKLLAIHAKTFKFLLSFHEWDFAFIVFTSTDRIQHEYWGATKIIVEHYQKLDNYIGEIIKLVKEKYPNLIVLIVSDHGFGFEKLSLCTNEFLMKRGYLKLKKEIYKKNTLIRLAIKNKVIREIGIKLLPSKIKKWLKKKSGIIELTPLLKDLIDWSSTKAFSTGFEIYINLQERDPLGTVSPKEYDKLRNKIINDLKTLKFQGKTIEVEILKREDIFKNSDLFSHLPDLVIVPTDKGIQAASPNIGFGSDIIESHRKKGNHRLKGIFIAWGENISPQRLGNLAIWDVTPTILDFFRIKIPNMDGRPIKI